MTSKQVTTEALRLPIKERAALAEKLIASLDESEAGDFTEVQLDEAERRYAAYKEGRITAKPANEVIRALRKKLR